MIKAFVNDKGYSLVNYLQTFAWKEDLDCHTAYYVIKSPANEIVLFFSLKCGALFDPLDEDIIEQRAQRAQELLKLVQSINSSGQEREFALQILEHFRSGQDISIEQLKRKIKINAMQAQQIWKQLNYDKNHEGNEQIIRVGHTYPGIEIVHFCSNDLIKEQWKSLNLNHPMGEVMFWQYIVPIICDVQKHIGCQYAFLFAADASEDGILINYYNVALKFEQPTEVGTNKPRYDLCCEFMCQEINQLKKHRQEYFDHFNPEDEMIV
ncbi:MAG: hypothetical protein K2N87_17225 [Eubacterium sp.]|nr:hypothetical protein [Eubacterium sp.]